MGWALGQVRAPLRTPAQFLIARSPAQNPVGRGSGVPDLQGGGLPHWGVALLVVLDKRIADDEFRQRDPSGNTVL